jgi:hypothetical protein
MVANKKRFTLDLDPDFQRRLKVAAALKGISMRQYCVAAIEAELAQDRNIQLRDRPLSEEGFDRLEALRNEIFGGVALSEDSADLIREQRELRSREL